MNKKEIKIMIPPGKYYIGDPANVFDRKKWLKLINENADPIWKCEDKKFIIVSVGGDGEYIDGDGNSYLVDSGSLGVVPLEIIKVAESDYVDAGRIVAFDKAVLFRYFDEKVFMVDDIVININSEETEHVVSENSVGKDYWEVF